LFFVFLMVFLSETPEGENKVHTTTNTMTPIPPYNTERRSHQ